MHKNLFSQKLQFRRKLGTAGTLNGIRHQVVTPDTKAMYADKASQHQSVYYDSTAPSQNSLALQHTLILLIEGVGSSKYNVTRH